jgi:NAD(P) transhydrogenase subunit alpha
MTIFIPNQTDAVESRVASIPAVVKRLITPQVVVAVESGAGKQASHPDSEYTAVGAQIVDAEFWAQADIVLCVRPPSIEQIQRMKSGAILIGNLVPHKNAELIAAMKEKGVTAMAMELLPRITRAQAMDVLSSQANLAGYKAVILAAANAPKIFPMLMTAAGTIQPCRVFVIGAGVAGLQAIATAKRLGAIVSAFDVRSAVKEQVQSVGAKFIELPMDAAEGLGGYAKELTPEQQQKQRELMAKVITESDVVITTAAVPGKPAPKLISGEVVQKMNPGSVIVDLAAETGGNCELTVPGEIITAYDVTIIGTTNLPGTLPVHASQVYANNLANLLKLIIGKEGEIKVDLADEVIAGVVVTK